MGVCLQRLLVDVVRRHPGRLSDAKPHAEPYVLADNTWPYALADNTWPYALADSIWSFADAATHAPAADA